MPRTLPGLLLCLLLALGCAPDAGPAGPVALGADLRSAGDHEGGAFLQDLDPDGPAARAGLHAGDRLLTLDGKAVDGSCTLERLLLGKRAGQEVPVTVRRGREVPAKPLKLAGALALHGRACQAGRAAGCFRLGVLYVRGQGVTADPKRANQLFDEACRGGSAAACAELGGRYLEGHGGTAGDARIQELVRRACNVGSAAGCAHLAFLYASGRGIPKDDGRALSLYQQACEWGDAAGCYNVGLHFEKARGSLEHRSLALIHYGRAGDPGEALRC